MKVTYCSNNSGGDWWLKDNDWFALEKSGWTIYWYADKESHYNFRKDCRFLGALASEASKEFPDMKTAIDEWEEITGQNHRDVGCECCGNPHDFYGTDV